MNFYRFSFRSQITPKIYKSFLSLPSCVEKYVKAISIKNSFPLLSCAAWFVFQPTEEIMMLMKDERSSPSPLDSEASERDARFSYFRLYFFIIIMKTPKNKKRSISWLSGFWRVSFEWKITYMFMACLDSAVYVVLSLCQRPIFILSAAVFCFKKCFYSAFLLPFWESYFSISPYRYSRSKRIFPERRGIEPRWSGVEEKLLK